MNTTFTGYSYEYMDCRAFKTELLILEGNLCFMTTYYAWIILIVMAVMAVLIFFLMWTTCFSIREVDISSGVPVMKPNNDDPLASDMA